LALEGVARLSRAVAALGATGGLVGVEPHAIELVARNLVGHGQQRAGIVDRGEAIAGVGAAVEEGLQVDGGNRAILLDAGFQNHLDGVAPAMAEERLLAAEGELDGAPVSPGEATRREVVGERLALAAEAATHRWHDDAQ